jgi:ABC-type multidrug transport system ATPase subunit
MSGAGKSTVLAMLSGDRVPTQGEGYLKGISMTYNQNRVSC